MVVIRMLLTGLIAISIATLPATGNAVASPGSAAIIAADQADMPCCPSGDAKANFKPADCIMKCAAHIGVIVPAMTAVLPYLAHRSLRPSRGDSLQGLAAAPPTHPPPV
jgi:hypothetical protein